MKIGAVMFFATESMQPAPLARAMEDRGFESLWVPEHTHIPSGGKSVYPAAGGLGVLVGDGQLKHYGPEEIIELYYSAKLFSAKLLNFGKLEASLSLDYQFLNHPGYNRDRGPACDRHRGASYGPADSPSGLDGPSWVQSAKCGKPL